MQPAIQLESQFINAGVIALLVSLAGYVCRSLMPQQAWVRHVAWLALLASLLCLATSLYWRSVSAEYFALSNMYESLLTVVMFMQLGFLVLDKLYPVPMMGWAAVLLMLGTLAYDLTLPTDIRPLQAALQSYWRAIHVPVILSSYALFTLAFISSVVYLIKDGLLQKKPAGESQALAAGAKTLALYDEVIYRCTLLGFPLLTIGIILGGLWANEAWGNYWSWDPKESMSLVTLLGYGVYLHLRVNGRHSGRMLAFVQLAAFVLMLVTYFGVNLMGVGLHSYGKIG